MGMKITMNVTKFKEELKATAAMLNQATRPAAQAGAQVIYDRALDLVPVSEAAHKFYGENKVYGPYSPGTLRDAIYQAFSEDNSYRDVSVYHISWNKDKAPYGFMVEFGTSKAPAHSFINRAIVETRPQVKAAMKQRYLEEVSGKA
jgi:HK97 gp10 family phage protein